MKSAQKSLDPTKTPFHWKHYEGEIILLNVRWYCSYGLSYRNLVEMMEERGLNLAHTTIMSWVHQYAPQIDKKIRPHLKRAAVFLILMVCTIECSLLGPTFP